MGISDEGIAGAAHVTCQRRLTICPAPTTPSLCTLAAAHMAEVELKARAWLALRTAGRNMVIAADMMVPRYEEGELWG
jgi:hypothetical protein